MVSRESQESRESQFSRDEAASSRPPALIDILPQLSIDFRTLRPAWLLQKSNNLISVSYFQLSLGYKGQSQTIQSVSTRCTGGRKWTPVTSGVPQGSLLGPLLFVLFINDLPDVVKPGVRAALYADDAKIYSAVQLVPDCVAVQESLSNMDVWTQRNNIQFNTTKCKVLTVTRKKQPLNYDYTLNHAQLERVTEEKDLGVIVNNTLSWEKHVNSVAAKANQLLGLLKRTCPLLTDVSVRRTLYPSLVKSQLCFVTQVWSPSQHYLKAKIERVQRRATRWILRTRVGELFSERG